MESQGVSLMSRSYCAPVLPRFISFEGIDGSGKTTAAEVLNKELRSRGVDTALLLKREVNVESAIAAQHLAHLSNLLWEKNGNESRRDLSDDYWFSLLCAWFHLISDHFVTPALVGGKVVIADFWTDTILARFCLKPNFAHQLLEHSFLHVVKPDLTFFLSVPPDIAATRKSSFGISETGGLDGESESGVAQFCAYQTAVMDAYKGLPGYADFIQIDAHNQAPAQYVAGMADRLISECLA